MTFSFQRTRGRTMAPSRTTSSESRPPTQHTFPAFNATGSREYFPETVHVCTKLDMVTKLQGTRFVQLQTIPFTDLPNRRERQGRSGGRIGLRKFYFINCACPTSRIPIRCDFKNYGSEISKFVKKKNFHLLFQEANSNIGVGKNAVAILQLVEINAKFSSISFSPSTIPFHHLCITLKIILPPPQGIHKSSIEKKKFRYTQVR